MNAQETRTVGVLHLLCPYCANLEMLRDDCMYCCGHGFVPGPKLYEGAVVRAKKPNSFRRAIRKWIDAACFGVLVGVPAAFLLLRALGILP